jgi:hypothetical protein
MGDIFCTNTESKPFLLFLGHKTPIYATINAAQRYAVQEQRWTERCAAVYAKGVYTAVRYSEGDRTNVAKRYAADCPKK